MHTDDFINITFHQLYYSLNISSAAYEWVQRRAKLIIMHGSDWGRMENVFIYGGNIGIELGSFDHDIGNGVLYHGCRNFDFHSVKIEEVDSYGVLIDNLAASYEVANSGGGISFESCIIYTRGAVSNYAANQSCVAISTCGDVRFYNVQFSCPRNCVEAIDLANNSIRNLMFIGCTFWNYGSDQTNIRYAIGTGAKNIQIIGCYFEGINRAVGVIYVVGTKTNTVLITGNTISRSLNGLCIYYLYNTSSSRINIRNNVYDNVSIRNALTLVGTNHHGTWEDSVTGHYVESFA